MKIGLALPHYDFSFPDGRRARVADVVSYALRAERAGFDEVWVADHLFFDLSKYGGSDERFSSPECLTLIAAILSATERIRVGSLVVNVAFRNPGVLLEQAKTLDDLSGSRFDLGLGAGWYEPEFAAAGVPFGTAGERIEWLAGVAGMLDGALEERVPLWIGAKGGPKLARLIAEHADGWNVSWSIDMETYAQRLAVLAEACATVKRDPATVTKSVGQYTLLSSSDAELEQRYERARAFSRGVLDGVRVETFADGALVGTPEQAAARIKEFEAMGVDQIILSLGALPFSVCDDEQLDIVANELFPLLR